MPELTLGLDLGTNSIGWALIEKNEDGQPCAIVRSGVRVFQEAVEAKTRTPKNQQRRDARSARKVLARRKMRRETLRSLLQKNGMLPPSAEELQQLFRNESADPYCLRRKGLDEALQQYEFGRALFHLNRRRGFQSNRKADKQEKDGKKLSDYKQAMKSLDEAIESSGCRTLGEYLCSQPSQRKRHTTREMYRVEFSKLWEKQAALRPDLYTEELRAKIFKVIFHQRPLKIQKFLIGKCTLEPTRKRAARALLAAQRFRIWQDLNNLTVRDPKTFDERKLEFHDRKRLFDLLDRGKSLTWLEAKKALGLHKNEMFNLEKGKKLKLPGNSTAAKMTSVLGERWAELSSRQQDALVEDWLTIGDDKGFQRRMKEHWSFDDETVRKLYESEEEKGYARLSLRAILKILPFLSQGLRYDEACSEAGYDHSRPSETTSVPMLGNPPEVRNPVVQKALWEARKVINALIKSYGKPLVIRIEMARDMKMGKKQREEYQKEQNRREKERDQTREALRSEFGISEPSREDILKYRLWVESDHVCLYTGQTISAGMLFSDQVDIEHILPYSRCLDDSYMNKTLCLAEENRSVKRNQSPYEAYSGSLDRYEALLVRVAGCKGMPYGKKRKFEQKELVTDEFVERQLNDTRYICVEVKDYLHQIGVAVEVSKGGATADLRHHWQLNRILNPADRNSKSREDHRHHAVDAVVIALTDRKLFHLLSNLSARNPDHASLTERGFQLPPPWSGFLTDVRESVAVITVSHASSHKISGALHEETAYGLAGQTDKNGKAEFAVRKDLSTFKEKKQLESIRDVEVKKLALARLEECAGNFKEAFGNVERPLLHKDGKTPIKSVRVTVVFDKDRLVEIKDSAGRPYKYFSMGSNHHVEILESIDGKKWTGVFVSTAEAANRSKNPDTPVFQKDHGPEWRYVMSLCINDMVELDDSGTRKLYRVQKMSDPNVDFRLHSASVLTLEDGTAEAQAAYDKATHLRSSINPLKARKPRKVIVSPLGDLKEAYD